MNDTRRFIISFTLQKKHLSACGYAEVGIVISPYNNPMKEEEMMKLVHAAKNFFEMYLGAMQVNICSAIIIIKL